MTVLFDHKSITDYKLKVNNCFIFDRVSKVWDLNLCFYLTGLAKQFPRKLSGCSSVRQMPNKKKLAANFNHF